MSLDDNTQSELVDKYSQCFLKLKQVQINYNKLLMVMIVVQHRLKPYDKRFTINDPLISQ